MASKGSELFGVPKKRLTVLEWETDSFPTKQKQVEGHGFVKLRWHKTEVFHKKLKVSAGEGGVGGGDNMCFGSMGNEPC